MPCCRRLFPKAVITSSFSTVVIPFLIFHFFFELIPVLVISILACETQSNPEKLGAKGGAGRGGVNELKSRCCKA